MVVLGTEGRSRDALNCTLTSDMQLIRALPHSLNAADVRPQGSGEVWAEFLLGGSRPFQETEPHHLFRQPYSHQNAVFLAVVNVVVDGYRGAAPKGVS
jgi:hypothetical protein